jgi:hypothetical protein
VLFVDAAGESAPVDVWLPPGEPALARYHLRRGADPVLGWAALGLCLDVGARSVTVPLVATAILPLVHRFLDTATRPLVFLLGRTGHFKTALALLAAGLYGDFGEDQDVLTWGGTFTSWEVTNHGARDVLVVMDDFKRASVDARDAIRFVQEYADSTARRRSGSELALRPSKWARSIVLATGEDMLPLQASTAARILYLRVGPGAVDVDRLTAAQERTRDLPGLTVGLLRWFAGQHGLQAQLAQDFRTRRRAVRLVLGSGTNVARVAANVAQLQVAWHVLGQYAHAQGWLRGAGLADWIAAGDEHCLALGREQLRLGKKCWCPIRSSAEFAPVSTMAEISERGSRSNPMCPMTIRLGSTPSRTRNRACSGPRPLVVWVMIGAPVARRARGPTASGSMPSSPARC